MATILGFPDPVNETSARVVAGGVVAMASTAVALDQPWLLAPLTYGFAARVLTGPTLSPLGQLATRVVTPRLPVEHKLVPGPPKRFAQGMGLGFSLLALVLRFGFGKKRASDGVLLMLVTAASLEAFFGVCLGCRIFAVLLRAGVVPESACASCADIWGRAGAPARRPA